jgi:hypothetical protein
MIDLYPVWSKISHENFSSKLQNKSITLSFNIIWGKIIDKNRLDGFMTDTC